MTLSFRIKSLLAENKNKKGPVNKAKVGVATDSQIIDCHGSFKRAEGPFNPTKLLWLVGVVADYVFKIPTVGRRSLLEGGYGQNLTSIQQPVY